MLDLIYIAKINYYNYKTLVILNRSNIICCVVYKLCLGKIKVRSINSFNYYNNNSISLLLVVVVMYYTIISVYI